MKSQVLSPYLERWESSGGIQPLGRAAIGLGEESQGLLTANLWQENSSTLFVKVKVQKFLRKAYTYLAEY